MRKEAVMAAPPVKRGGGGEIDNIGKIPLGLQQLALARERAMTAGDKKLAAAIGKKMAEMLGVIEV
jgi:hypothetical protein